MSSGVERLDCLDGPQREIIMKLGGGAGYHGLDSDERALARSIVLNDSPLCAVVDAPPYAALSPSGLKVYHLLIEAATRPQNGLSH